MIHRKNIYNQNFAVKMKQKYILWKTMSKTYFLPEIYLSSNIIWNISFGFKADFHEPRITSHVIFFLRLILWKLSARFILINILWQKN